jgi:SPFH domain / Band 7 family
VEWVVQYRISDPVKFLFDVREPRGTLRDVSESVMREVVGDRTVDEVITIGRQEIETEALAKMQALSTKYAMGISIDQGQSNFWPRLRMGMFLNTSSSKQTPRKAFGKASTTAPSRTFGKKAVTRESLVRRFAKLAAKPAASRRLIPVPRTCDMPGLHRFWNSPLEKSRSTGRTIVRFSQPAGRIGPSMAIKS